MNLLKKILIENNIIDIKIVDDYIQLETNEYFMNIYNPLKVIIKSEKKAYDYQNATDAIANINEKIIGKSIMKAEVDNSVLSIELSSCIILAIQLHEELYKGPEAVVITEKKGNRIIVI